MIRPPKSSEDYPQRSSDCQEAMQGMFQAMITQMRAAGWEPKEIYAAIEILTRRDADAESEAYLNWVDAAESGD